MNQQNLSRIFLLGLGFIVYTSLYAQYKYTKNDSIKIYDLLNLADELDFQGKIDSAFNVISSANLLSRDRNFIRGEGFAVLKYADLILKSRGTVSAVLTNCKNGIALGHKIHDYFITGLGNHQISQYYRDQAEWDSCLAYLKYATIDYKKIPLDEYLAYAYNDIAFTLDKKGEYYESIDYYLKALIIFENQDTKKEIANTLNNIATVYNRLNNRPEAIKYFKKSIQIGEAIKDVKRLAAAYGNLAMSYSYISLDTAEIYQEKAVENASKTGVLSTQAQANANTATLLSRSKKYAEAIYYEQKAIEQFKLVGDKNKIAQRYLSLASLYHLQGDSLFAINTFNDAEKYVNLLSVKPLFQTLNEQKSKFFADRDNHVEAFKYYKIANSYKDSLLNEKALQNIAQLQIKYDVAKKDLEIIQLNADQKIKQVLLTNQKALLQNQSLVALNQNDQIKLLEQEKIINDTRLKSQESEIQKTITENKLSSEILKNEKLLAEDKLQLEKRNKTTILMASLLALFLSLILFNQYKLKQQLKAQEQLMAMRNTISKDLHDEVGSTLTSIAMLSQVSEKAFDLKPSLVKENLYKISNQSKNIQQNLSDIVWAIRPDTDKASSIITRIREFAANLVEPANINFTLDADAYLQSASFNEILRKEILLIIKEALNNIVKHAGAKSIKLNCISTDTNIKFIMEDDGHWNENKYATGSGINSMYERTNKLRGKLTYDKSTSGTILTLEIPIIKGMSNLLNIGY